MIRDLEAYRRIREAEEDRELEELTMDESIRITEALLMSSLVTDHQPDPDCPRPLSLAIALGIPPERIVRPNAPTSRRSRRRPRT